MTSLRKLHNHHLLLIMFLVGAASGFLVSSAGWWGLNRGAHDLAALQASTGNPLRLAGETQAMALHVQSLYLDALRKRDLPEAEMAALAHAETELFRVIQEGVQTDAARAVEWGNIAAAHARLEKSRRHLLALVGQEPERALHYHAGTTQPLADALLAETRALLPAVLAENAAVQLRAEADNARARALLIALSVLASVFFCATAALTWRESAARRRNELAREREHTMFRTLFQGSKDGVILLRNARVADMNRSARALFALPDGADAQALDLDRLCADSGTGSLQERIAHGRPDQARRFEWEFQALDGRRFPAEVAVDIANLGKREVVQVTVRDITRRKEIERSMRLTNQAFENSVEGIAITDANGNILTVNETFTTITGYARDEVIGRNPRILSSGRQTREFYQAMWETLSIAGKWQGEVWNKRKNGDIYPEWLTISRVVDEHGRVTNFVGVFSDITERKSAEERLLYQVYYDQLTDLPNRVLFNDRLGQVLSMARRHDDRPFAVMFLDLDRFKTINDTMGHQVGDRLLQQAAHRLRGAVRESDTVARMSGDEFTVLLSEIGNERHAANVAQKILEAFRQPFQLEGQDVYVAASIGIAVYPTDGRTPEALLKHADMAMYRAKGAGGSWYELYDAGMASVANERFVLETALHKALERNELELHYQPQFECESGRLAGFEALLRWGHPELGMVSPAQFIPLAEETGMIVDIGEWVLRSACAQAKSWERTGHPLRVAVNLSARQFRQGDLADVVQATLAEFRLAPQLLELELTESILMEDSADTGATLEKLHAMGVQISIDDFGTGYSSLSYLKRMPIQVLKIDRSFVRDIHQDPDDRAIVRAVIALAHNMKLKVVAEGVETPEQLAFLREHGCDTVQGYLFSRPIPGGELLALLAAGAALGSPA